MERLCCHALVQFYSTAAAAVHWLVVKPPEKAIKHTIS